MRHNVLSLGLVAALAFAGCTSDDDAADTSSTAADTSSTTASDDTTADTATGDTATGDTTTTSAAEPDEATTTTEPITGPSPGVTADTVKIGFTYVDTEALAEVNINLKLGDHRAVYQALIDDINANGGIHGRTLEAVFAPIDPTSPTPAEEACLRLTEDEDVFMVVGFLLQDAVVCPAGVYETAVLGGDVTAQRQEQARAPWITWEPDTELPQTIVRTLAESGALDGTLGVFAHANDTAILDDLVLPALTELGIEPAEVGVIDAPTDDTAAIQSDVSLVSELFQAADVDTLLLVGATSALWAQYTNDDPSYRPLLRFLDVNAPNAFLGSEATLDTSILDGALAGGPFGPDQARFDDATMQECIEILTAAGLDTPEPSGFDADDRTNQPYQAAFQACPDIFLLRALLEAAGENLNYGTLAVAIDGLEVTLPGDPSPRIFGTGSAADGDPSAYVFSWNEASKSFVRAEG